MNILITGANGQLGNEMRVLSKENGQHAYFFTDVQELDICDEQSVHGFVKDNRIDVIVNCAAYTAVDKAEDNQELCDKLNHVAPGYLAAAAEACGAALIQVSTDYVFDGTGHTPYTEEASTCPNSVYGSTKLAGEQAVMKHCSRAMIIRTAWLYSIYGNNFVKTMLRLGRERETLGVVFDQIGTPTYANDLARAIFAAISQGIVPGIYHFSNEGVCSWYDFTLELPADALGRAMADVQRMCGSFEAPETSGGTVRLTGRLPVATARGYAREVAAYTHGLGRWAVLPAGYGACHNADEIVSAAGYDPDADVENPADSVFCAHGAGYLVKWDEVPARAHLSTGLERRLNGETATEEADAEDDANARRRRADAYRGTLEQDKELLAIFERTYGKIRRRGETGDAKKAARAALHTAPAAASVPAKPVPAGPDYLLVDGYNVIFAWDDLRKLADGNLDAARRRLMDILCNYAGYRRCVPILVFDAYKVRGGAREVEQYHNLYVVYTREAETADMYIERATHELAKEHRTRVVSSDGAEQIIVMGHGALRVSARAFEEEVKAVEKEIREFLEE